jgi:opacity protein-like surface antigen
MRKSYLAAILDMSTRRIMSKLHKSFSVVVAAFAGSSAIAADLPTAPPPLYLAVGVGYDAMPDRNLNYTGFAVSSQWTSGWGALLAAGYRGPYGLRSEIEFSQRASRLRSFDNTIRWTGTQWDDSLMVNVLYDFRFGWPVVPYIGAGIGGTNISWGDNFRNPNPQFPSIYDHETSHLGWQGIVGASYDVTQKMELALDFRVKGASAPYSFPGSQAGTFVNDFHYLTHSVFLTFRYGFNP